jgi:CRP/FNR family cyclic AMP-dependent transcriptional regulator
MKKILIIEDNTEVRENTAEILELTNYEVFTAENGKVGVELALKEKPDLVVCDIVMPVLDGYGVYHLLRKHSETANIPFIFLTAKSEKADFRKGMGMGADDYIMKPFDGIDLLNAIEQRLDKAAQLKQYYTGPGALGDFLLDVKKMDKVTLTSDLRDTYNYNKKQTVYTEGQRPRSVFYVVSGKVKTARNNDDGKELITGIHGAGTYFGYIAVLENANYKEEAQALEETILMIIPREDFLELVSADMQIAQTFIRIIAQDVAEQEELLLSMAYSSVRKKVAYGIVRLLGAYKSEPDALPELNLSRENMAQSIGIATESLVRTLSDFKEEKLIEIGIGRVIILDEKRLRNLPY